MRWHWQATGSWPQCDRSTRRGGTDSPHYQIRIRGDADFRVAVNVLSQEKPAEELLYVADENFLHPVTQNLPGLPDGFTPLASQPGGMALDFIRANLFDRQKMQPELASVPGPDNDLADKLDDFVRRAAVARLPACMPSGSAGGPKRSRTRSSASGPATGFMTST